MTDVVRDTNPDLDLIAEFLDGETAFNATGSEWDDARDALERVIEWMRSERAGREKAETALRPFAALGDEFTPDRHPGYIEEVWRFPWQWIWDARAVLAGEGDTP